MASRTRGLVKSLRQPEHRLLCELLAKAREDAGLSQENLAKRLKKPQSFVAKYEGGQRRIDVVGIPGHCPRGWCRSDPDITGPHPQEGDITGLFGHKMIAEGRSKP